MRVVIDTNIIFVSVSRKSPFHWVYECIINGNVELCVTTEILLEYEEIISQRMNIEVAESMLDAFKNTKSIVEVTNHFEWSLIKKDLDDNKFVDCAISSSAVCIVTNDKDFDVLKNINFPKVRVINLEEFRLLLVEQKIL